MTILGVFGPQYFMTCSELESVNNAMKAYTCYQPYNITSILTGDEKEGTCNQVVYFCKKHCIPYQKYKHCYYSNLELMVEKIIMNCDIFVLFAFYQTDIIDSAINFALKYNVTMQVVYLL